LQETKEIQSSQQKLKKLEAIADFAPNLEIIVGVGSQAKTMKLGDLMKDSKSKTNNLEQNLGDVFSQIQLQLETQQQRLDQMEERRPKTIIREAKSCCLPRECALM